MSRKETDFATGKPFARKAPEEKAEAPTMTPQQAHTIIKEVFEKLNAANVAYFGVIALPVPGDEATLTNCAMHGVVSRVANSFANSLAFVMEEGDEMLGGIVRAGIKLAGMHDLLGKKGRFKGEDVVA